MIEVFVKPGSKKGPLVVPESDGTLTVFVRERAVEGSANEAVIALLAKHLHVAKSRLIIARGQTSRHKLIEVQE